MTVISVVGREKGKGLRSLGYRGDHSEEGGREEKREEKQRERKGKGKEKRGGEGRGGREEEKLFFKFWKFTRPQQLVTLLDCEKGFFLSLPLSMPKHPGETRSSGSRISIWTEECQVNSKAFQAGALEALTSDFRLTSYS